MEWALDKSNDITTLHVYPYVKYAGLVNKWMPSLFWSTLGKENICQVNYALWRHIQSNATVTLELKPVAK